MPFRLRRDDARFGDLLTDLAAHLPGTASMLAEVLGEQGSQMRELLPDLRAIDHAADVGANAVLRALSSAIVTPFDRVDVYQLAFALRTVVRQMVAAGEDIVELEPEELPAVATELVQILGQAAEVAEGAVRHVPQADPVTDACVEINRLARQARDAHRRFLVEVCAPGSKLDAGQLVGRVVLAQSLRAAVESFGQLAHALQTIAVRES